MENKHTMFVYGTLMSASTREWLGLKSKDTKAATLFNYKKTGLNVLPERGSKVEGMLFEVDDRELKILDTYEGMEQGWYRRFKIKVTIDNKAVEANVYQLT